LSLKIMQRGFNYSQDGPGNRLVYHLQGCNLECPWCSNPEGIPRDGCMMQTGEALPQTVCPQNGIKKGRIDPDVCSLCKDYSCIEHSCGQLKWSCCLMDESEILEELDRSRMMFFDGGGLTLTGGEATLQFEEIKSLLAAARRSKIHTALETNATHPRLPELFPVVDWLIMDFKHYDDAVHEDTLGISGAIVKENIRKAAKQSCEMLVRIPLVNGFNASKEDAQAFAEFLRDCNITEVELLKYHEYGREKWRQCGRRYTVKDGFVSDIQYQDILQTFGSYKITCVST
jgi:pyruvate formate lyase activating enzyme